MGTGSRTVSGWVNFNSFLTYDSGFNGIFGTSLGTYPNNDTSILVDSSNRLYMEVYYNGGDHYSSTSSRLRRGLGIIWWEPTTAPT